MNGSITDICPFPKSVTIGRCDYIVHEARLRDLAELESAFHAGLPATAENALRQLDDAPSDADGDKLLFTAYDADDGEGLPGWDSAAFAKWMDTSAGLIAFMILALRQGNRLTDDELLDVIRGITPAEFAAVKRVFLGIDPRDSVAAAIFNRYDAGPTTPARPLSWQEVVDTLADRRGWPYDTVLDLSLRQFRGAIAGWAGRTKGFAVADTDRAAEIMADVNRRRVACGLAPYPAV